MKKQKDIFFLGTQGTYRTVMLCWHGPSNPEQASLKQGRHKFVHTAWIPDSLLISNSDIAYRQFGAEVLTLDIYSIKNSKIFSEPHEKPFFFPSTIFSK